MSKDLIDRALFVSPLDTATLEAIKPKLRQWLERVVAEAVAAEATKREAMIARLKEISGRAWKSGNDGNYVVSDDDIIAVIEGAK